MDDAVSSSAPSALEPSVQSGSPAPGHPRPRPGPAPADPSPVPSPEPSSSIRVAFIGSRGIPARYGGFETLAEELGERLREHGIELTVYCRSHSTSRRLRRHRGSELVVLPTVPTKYLDTPVHTLLSSLHAWRRRFDAVLVVNAANTVFLPLLRWSGAGVALHVDGIDWQRAKWGAFGRTVYRVSERLSKRLADVVLTDAVGVREYIASRYGIKARRIAYGVEPKPLPPGETLTRLGLEPGRYFLYVARFVPENNPHRVVAAYRDVGGDMPLVMVGWAPYARRFIRSFTRVDDERVRFPGAIYGEGYRELLSHAFAYVHGTEARGVHPSLIEAMGYGNCPVVNDTPDNREVAAETAIYFRADRPESLTAVLERLRTAPSEVARRGEAAAARARLRYSWEAVVAAYAALFEELSQKR